MVKPIRAMVLAFVLATGIFACGIVVGQAYDRAKTEHFTQVLRSQELEFQNFLTQREFLEIVGENDCNAKQLLLNDLQYKTRKLGAKLQGAASSSEFDRERIFYIRDKYFILEVQLYGAILAYNKECTPKINTILFFYKKDQLDSLKQGAILDSLNEKFNNTIAVFSLDFDSDLDVIKMLKRYYGVKSTPALVINGKAYEGLQSEDFLLEQLS